jgi:hypothetical protein
MSFKYNNQGRQPRVAAMFNATTSIIFLETPHQGSNTTVWANVAVILLRTMPEFKNPCALESLTKGSDVLKRLQNIFIGLLQGITVYSLLEEFPVMGIGIVRHACLTYRVTEADKQSRPGH